MSLPQKYALWKDWWDYLKNAHVIYDEQDGSSRRKEGGIGLRIFIMITAHQTEDLMLFPRQLM